MRSYIEVWSILVLPEIMFLNKQLLLDPLRFEQYILTKFIIGYQAVSENIGFTDNGAGETSLHKQVIE